MSRKNQNKNDYNSKDLKKLKRQDLLQLLVASSMRNSPEEVPTQPMPSRSSARQE